MTNVQQGTAGDGHLPPLSARGLRILKFAELLAQPTCLKMVWCDRLCPRRTRTLACRRVVNERCLTGVPCNTALHCPVLRAREAL